MATNSTKETIIVELQINDDKAKKAKEEVEHLTDSIFGLRKANKELRAERDKLSTATEKEIDRINELNEMIDKNDEIIKKNSSSLEKQRLNVGNYQRGITDALKEVRIGGINVGDVLDKLQKANEDLFQGMIAGFKESGLQATLFGTATRAALTATGIGVFLVALGAMVVYWDDITDAIGLTDNAAKKMFETQEEGFKAVSALLQDYIQDLRDASQSHIALAEAEGKSLGTRLKMRRDALDLEQSALVVEQKRLQNLIGETRELISNGKQRDKTEFIEKEKEYQKLLDESNDKYIANVRERALLEKQIANAENDDIDKNVEHAKEQRQKEKDEAYAAYREMIELKIIALDEFIRQEHDKYVAAEQEKAAFQKAIDQHIADYRAKLDADELARKKANAEQLVRIEKFKADSIVLLNKGMLERNRGLSLIANAIFKKNAIQETILNTRAAAVAAFKVGSSAPFPLGVVLGPLLAAAAGAFGFAQVSDMLGINFFAQGGDASNDRGKRMKAGGRDHSSGGTWYMGQDGNRFNVQRGEGIYVLKREAEADTIGKLSALNQKHGGNSFNHVGWYHAYGGQVATQQASAAANTRDIEVAFSNALRRLPPIYVIAQDVADVNNAALETQTRAQVL